MNCEGVRREENILKFEYIKGVSGELLMMAWVL